MNRRNIFLFCGLVTLTVKLTHIFLNFIPESTVMPAEFQEERDLNFPVLNIDKSVKDCSLVSKL